MGDMKFGWKMLNKMTELEIAKDALHCAIFYRDTEQCHGVPISAVMSANDRVVYWEHRVAILEARDKDEHSAGPIYEGKSEDVA